MEGEVEDSFLPNFDGENITDAISEPFAQPLWRINLFVTLLAIILIVGLLGNLLVIWATFTSGPLKKDSKNLLIISFSILNLATVLFVIPILATYKVMQTWIFGHYFCLIFIFLDYFFHTASTFSLCAIALDRYLAIANPISYAYHRKARKILLVIVCVWFISALINLSSILITNFLVYNAENTDICIHTNSLWHNLAQVLLVYLLPLILLIGIYVMILFLVRFRVREQNSKDVVDSLVSGTSDGFQMLPVEGNLNENTEDAENEEEKKTINKDRIDEEKSHILVSFDREIDIREEISETRIFAIITGVYLATWFPFYFIYTLTNICSGCISGFRYFALMFELLLCLGHSSSALIPIILILSLPEYKRVVARIYKFS